MTQRPRTWLLWTLVVLMVLFWTLNPIVGKVALRHFPPLLLVALRTTLAGLFVLPAFLLWNRGVPRVAARDLPPLLALSLLGQMGNQLLFIVGLSMTSVSHAAFIFATVPITILLLAAALRQEALTARKLLGMGICAAGVLWLTHDHAGGEATLAGDAVLAGSTLAFACFTVFGKTMRARYGPLTMNAAAYCGGAILLQPVIWLGFGGFELFAAPFAGWAALVYMAVFPAVLGYLIYYWALGYVPASRLAVLQYLQPPLATSLGALLLGETVSWIVAASGALILTGVYLSERD